MENVLDYEKLTHKCSNCYWHEKRHLNFSNSDIKKEVIKFHPIFNELNKKDFINLIELERKELKNECIFCNFNLLFVTNLNVFYCSHFNKI